MADPPDDSNIPASVPPIPEPSDDGKVPVGSLPLSSDSGYFSGLQDYTSQHLHSSASEGGYQDHVLSLPGSIQHQDYNPQLPGNNQGDNPGIQQEYQDIAQLQRHPQRRLPPDVKEAFQLALKEGSQPSFRTRLMFVGPYGAGKTSTERCLLNKPFVAEYNITNGIDVKPSTCRVDITKVCKWKHIEGEESEDPTFEDEVVKKVSLLLHQGQEASKCAANPSDAKAGTKRGSEGAGRIQRPPDELSSTHHIVQPDLFLEMKLRRVKKEPVTSVVHEEEFTAWDFAGQSTYYPTHQVFLTHRAIYLVVLNVMEALNSPINNSKLGFSETAQNGISSRPIIDLVDYWLNCIYSHTAPDRPDTNPAESIIIVLTHKDELQQKFPGAAGKKMIQDYRRAIFKHIDSKVYSGHVLQDVFAIANNATDDPEVDRLREAIVTQARLQPYWGEEIPLKWLAVRDKLRKTKEEITSPVISLEHALKKCKDIGISDMDDLCKVLLFYHAMGEFVFFEESNLKNYIILEPQWLINALSKVITIPRFYQPSESVQSVQMWKVLQDHGLLTDKILDAVWGGSPLQEDNHPSLESSVKEHLTNLMYKFRLMLPMRLCNMTEVHKEMVQLGIDESKASMVPCLLPLLKSQESGTDPCPGKKRRLNGSHIPKALVIFNDGFIPVGITSHLISGLVMNEAWVLTGKVFQNSATFLPEGQDGTFSITIHQQDDCLHLQGHILDDKPTRPNWLRPYLFVLLEQLGFVVRSCCPKATFGLAVECGCGAQDTGTVEVGPTGEGIEGKDSIFCPHHKKWFPTESFSPWFDVTCLKRQSASPAAADLSDQTLLKVAQGLGPDWRGLGYRLVESHIVEDLCTPLQGGPGLYGVRMLVRWYQGLYHADITSIKDQLIQVLEGEERADLVQIIKECHGHNEQHLFHKLSRGLTKIWRKVGERLGVNAGDMDAIETPQIPDYHPGLRMLVTWRDQGGCRTELIGHLKELNHHAIANSLELGEI